ncbi:uncharacterized protein LOC144355612 [Saccoglossus kowalevskii]
MWKLVENEVFDSAQKTVDNYWNQCRFDGFPVTSSYKGCTEMETYHKYDTVHNVLEGSLCKTRPAENQDIIAELRFAVKHIDKRIGAMVICKCEDGDCQYCSTHPVRANNAMDFIRARNGLPSPIPSTEHLKHFITYLKAIVVDQLEEKDLYMQRYEDLKLGKCHICPNYILHLVGTKIGTEK